MVYDPIFVNNLENELSLSKKMLKMGLNSKKDTIGTITKQNKGNIPYYYEKKRDGKKVKTKYLGKSLDTKLIDEIKQDKEDQIVLKENIKALKKKISFLEKMIKKYEKEVVIWVEK